MDLFVPEHAIDYDEVFRRGGRNFGDEDFALFKCPACRRIYLMDYEVDTVFSEPDDLAVRVPADEGVTCFGCGTEVPAPFVGGAAPDAVRVTWDELRDSRWRWAASVEVMLRNEKRMKQESGR